MQQRNIWAKKALIRFKIIVKQFQLFKGITRAFLIF